MKWEGVEAREREREREGERERERQRERERERESTKRAGVTKGNRIKHNGSLVESRQKKIIASRGFV